MDSPRDTFSDTARLFAVAIRDQRFKDAVALGRNLVSLRQDDATAWYNLAYCLRATRQFGQALAAYQRAIELGIDRPDEAMINRAAILIEHLARPADAELELLGALAINPNSLPAFLTLGQLHEDQGQLAEAEIVYQNTISAYPANGRAHARLAGLRRQRGEGKIALDELRSAVRRVTPDSDDFSEIMMGLGQAYESEARFAEAFAAYSDGKRVSAALVPTTQRYNRASNEAMVEAIIRTPICSAEHVRLDIRPEPIFVCGMFRSGSTLVEQILARHPRVFGAGEMEAIPAIAADLADYPNCVPQLSSASLDSLRERYWEEVDDVAQSADLIVDKRPDNFLHLGLIRRLFPAAPIVHTVRDKNDIALSVFSNLFGPAVPYSHRLSDIRHWQELHGRLIEHWRANLPGGFHDVVYELLVADPRTAIARLLDHCRLEWSEACLSGPDESRNVRTLSQWQVREAIHSRSVHRASNFDQWLNSD